MKYQKYFLEIIVWGLIIAILISLIYYNMNEKNEHFTLIGPIERNKRKMERIRLQTLINNYESKVGCCEGYTQPSNNCNFSFNNEIGPGCYKQ
jgi:hypothetical protein